MIRVGVPILRGDSPEHALALGVESIKQVSPYLA